MKPENHTAPRTGARRRRGTRGCPKAASNLPWFRFVHRATRHLSRLPSKGDATPSWEAVSDDPESLAGPIIIGDIGDPRTLGQDPSRPLLGIRSVVDSRRLPPGLAWEGRDPFPVENDPGACKLLILNDL